MRWLNKLAAWYLRGKVVGVMFSAPKQSNPYGAIIGWIYGDGWWISFDPGYNPPSAKFHKQTGEQK